MIEFESLTKVSRNIGERIKPFAIRADLLPHHPDMIRYSLFLGGEYDGFKDNSPGLGPELSFLKFILDQFEAGVNASEPYRALQKQMTDLKDTLDSKNEEIKELLKYKTYYDMTFKMEHGKDIAPPIIMPRTP